MDYSKQTLPTGLRLLTIPMPQVKSATLMILVGAGSRYEEERTNGVTHFLEHMLFKGTKRRPSAKALSQVIDSIGGEWNGATGKESSSYYIKVASHQLGMAFDILCDMLTQSLFDPREIEREKGVIKSEIALYEDTPARRVGEIFEALLYPGSSLGWDIAGTPDTVSSVKRDDFTKLYEEVYRPENMVVVVSGGIREKEVRRLTNKYLSTTGPAAGFPPKKTHKGPLFGGPPPRVTRSLEEKFIQDEPRVIVKEKKTDQAHLVLGVRGNARGHPDRWAEEVVATILGAGMSSRLWIAVRERRGLAYYVSAGVASYRDNGYLAISAGVDPGKIGGAIKVILREVGGGKWEVGSKELKKAKEFIKGHMFLGLEDTRSVAGFFGGFELLENKIMTPDEVARAIDSVTSEDVVRVAKEFFVEERLNLAIIGPYSDSERFKKLLRI